MSSAALFAEGGPTGLASRSQTGRLELSALAQDDVQRFVDVFGAARSAADFYRCRSLLTRLGTPDEVVTLPRLLGRLPPPERRWLAGLHRHLSIEGDEIRRFDRFIAHEDIVLYRVASAPRSSTVLIAFTGLAERLMLETPAFLQHLPDDTDVLLLRDSLQSRYLKGIPRIADDLAGVIAQIREAVAPDYARIQTIGASMGGAAALHAAALVGAERGVSVGGFPIGPVDVIGTRSASPEGHASPSGSPGRDGRPLLICVFSGGNDKDRAGAERLTDVLPIDAHLGVVGVERHAVLDEVRKLGRLRELLTLLLREHIPAGGAHRAEVVLSPQSAAEPLPPSSSGRRRVHAALLHFISRASRRVSRSATELLVRIHLRAPMPRSIRLRISHAAYGRLGLILPEMSRRRRKHGSVGMGS